MQISLCLFLSSSCGGSSPSLCLSAPTLLADDKHGKECPLVSETGYDVSDGAHLNDGLSVVEKTACFRDFFPHARSVRKDSEVVHSELTQNCQERRFLFIRYPELQHAAVVFGKFLKGCIQ